MIEDRIINQLIEAQSITAERLKLDFISKLETNIKQGSDVPFYLQHFEEDFTIRIIESFNKTLSDNHVQKAIQKNYFRYLKSRDLWKVFNKETLEYFINKYEETTTDYAWIAVYLFEIYLYEEIALAQSELRKKGIKRTNWRSTTDSIHKKWNEILNKYVLKVPGMTLYGIKSEPYIGLRGNDISEEDNIMNALENGGFD